MNFLRFFKANINILLFGVLMTFFSSFGQTFLLSLYIPEITKTLKITPAVYSTFYSLATLLSATTIIFAGKYIDRVPLKHFTAFVLVGFILANILAGFTANLVMLFMAIFMLRFFGQGLSSHTAMTAMGRYFNKARGKALSIANLGYPLGEGLLPIVILSLIMALGWRYTFWLSALGLTVVLVPAVIFLLRNFSKEDVKESYAHLPNPVEEQEVSEQKIWTQRAIIHTPAFYLFAPTVFLVGFTITALFFYQTYIADFKGWTREWMALNITAYAVSSFAFSIIAGPLIDRFTARRMFPVILLPMAMGLMVLIVFTHPLSNTFYWALVGITAGLNPTITNALYAEQYGTQSLGTVRSLFTFVMVASTALGPVTYSLLLEKGFNFNHIHGLLIAIVALNLFAVLLARKTALSKSKDI